MTDEQIIKALECCVNWGGTTSCADCPFYNTGCLHFNKLKEVLDLINRQKSEVERLKAELNELYQEREQAKSDIEKALEELKELELSYEKDIQTARIETAVSFAEMLKEKTRTKDRIIIYGEDIDNVLKEIESKQ